MSSLSTILLFVTACYACVPNLQFRVNEGNYLIVNPDPEIYTGIQAFNETGSACTATVIRTNYFSVEGCGLVNVRVDLSTNENVVTSCTISADGAVKSQSGYSLPLHFIMQANSLLGTGTAHYHCDHYVGKILVKNPRPELYAYSKAMSNTEECVTTHLVENQVIEISGCQITGLITCVLGARPNLGYMISRKTNIFLFDCVPNPINITTDGETNGMTYSCYSDGTIVADNPRQELFVESYAEQNGIVCDSVFDSTLTHVVITGCSQSQPIVLVLSKLPITNSAMVIRPNNVFLIECFD